jgi:hypothetical protein
MVVLNAAKAAGVDFQLNSGQRTMREQAALYRLYRLGRGNLAAVPSPNAPHIRVGRQDHAVDVDAPSGGAKRLAAWLSGQGGRPGFPVPGEPWHIEMPGKDLKRIAAKWSRTPVLRRGSKGPSVVRLKKLLYDKGIREFSGEHSSNRYNPFFSIWTEKAVKQFQESNGMKADGIVGATTWKAL